MDKMEQPVSPRLARRPKVAVIGAGFTGLTAALRLAQKGFDVQIFEKQEQIGGLARGFHLADGTPLASAYHFLYKSDSALLNLIQELGIRDIVRFYPDSIAAHYKGRLYPFLTPRDLLNFTPLSLWNRIRTGLVALYLRGVTDWKSLSKMSAYQWLKLFNGKRATQLLWEPLLRGKFGEDFDQVSMAWLWRRLNIRQKSVGPARGYNKGNLGYPTGGFEQIIEALRELLVSLGAKLKTRVELATIDFDSVSKLPYLVADGGREYFDAIAVTLPNKVFTRLVGKSDLVNEVYLQTLESVPYLAAVTMVFTTPESISPYFWHQILEADAPFLLFLSLSELVGSSQFRGKHVHYIGDYVREDDALMKLDNDEIKRRWLKGLTMLIPDFDSSSVLEAHVFKFPNAQHVATPGYENRAPKMRTPLRQVYLSNFSQVYPDDRGINYAVESGERLAEMIACDLPASPSEV